MTRIRRESETVEALEDRWLYRCEITPDGLEPCGEISDRVTAAFVNESAGFDSAPLVRMAALIARAHEHDARAEARP